MTATPPATGDMIACDNLVRIYSVADVEVVALQGLDLRIRTARWSRSWAPRAVASRRS